MDDLSVVSFTELLSQCISRCVIDWCCFCDRQEKDDSFVDNHIRNGIIQFCRAQREIFLKLYLLHEFMLKQKKLDRIVEKAYAFENYLYKCGSDIAMNLRKVPTSDLLVACPNTALAVDLLSSGKYTRMPLMLPQLAESAVTNAVPLPPLSNEEADLTMSKLNSEYNLQFWRSKCKDLFITMEFRNGNCIIKREQFFSVTLIYDFFSWQTLSAVPLLLEQFGCSTDGEARTSFFTLINYCVAIYNKEKKGSIFDEIFASANLYCGKLIMDKLKSQASDYKSLKMTVTDFRYYVTSDPDHMLLSCSDIRPKEDEFLVLEVICFPNFQHDDLEGLTLVFKMDKCGRVNMETLEIADLLRANDISEHRLDQWLENVAALLEKYQLNILNNTANVFMNHATGSLNIPGFASPLTLKEYGKLIEEK
ncbi:hypothetical protein BgAZ_106560 [Babesia gibsoni]|uniref:Mediator of RNA polymerase II transcription subunit 14 n=1 Tax=Babesia gibsoni TaxID=33632 RepID=A0AAD8PFZ2_BABGI|nr:hypothetical protein BgAZ_106560 [Babesia gibsoni]